MRLPLLSTLALLALAATASAQTTLSLGLRVGGNYATRAGDDPQYNSGSGFTSPSPFTQNKTEDYNRSGLLAPQFGAVLDVRFGKLAVQPAVLFSQKEPTKSSTSRRPRLRATRFFSRRPSPKIYTSPAVRTTWRFRLI